MDIYFGIVFFVLVVYKFLKWYEKSVLIYPSVGNYTDGQAWFYLSPLYNYPFFIIGIFFGMINYVIQKSYTKSMIKETGKYYLSIPLCFLNLYKENRNTKVISISILGMAAILFLIISYPILFSITADYSDKYLSVLNSNFYVNLFYLFDSEIFIVVFMVVFISLFILGDNFFVDFFSHEYWTFLSRSYFTYILICDQAIIYIFYQSESRIKLEIFNILFFSLFTVSLIVVTSIFVHIVFEMPFKRLNKIIWDPIKNAGKEFNAENILKTPPKNKTQNLTKSNCGAKRITEVNEEEDDDEIAVSEIEI